MATYGEGDPTDNAMEFYEWLQNGDADLTGLNYSVSVLFNYTLKSFNYSTIFRYLDWATRPTSTITKWPFT